MESKRTFILGALAGSLSMLMFSVTASLVNDSELISFQPGTPLTAGDLNKNTQTLRASINDNQQKLQNLGAAGYHYADYLLDTSAYQSKTFSKRFPAGTDTTGLCQTIVWEYSASTVQPGNVIVTDRSQRSFFADNSICKDTIADTFQDNGSSYLYTKRIRPVTAGVGGTIDVTYIYNEGIPMLTTNMRVGASWGGATETSTDSLGNSVHIARTRTLLGTQSMELNIDGVKSTHDNCLRIRTVHNIATGIDDYVWYCPGLGVVKLMFNNSVWEITSLG